MMIGPFGAVLCFLARAHKERRLRKGDDAAKQIASASISSVVPVLQESAYRICDRCGRMRAVKTRKKGAV